MSADSPPGLSVIVPVLNEAASVPQLVKHLQEIEAEQIILVDGGSDDRTVKLLRDSDLDLEVIVSSKGRARQMNAGALQARFDTLLFLHADTQLPDCARLEIFKSSGWGRFDVRFESSSKAMRVIAFFINGRSRWSGIATGDQAIFVKKILFDRVGQFPDIALMEDVAFCKRLKREEAPYCSRAQVTTSARRWEQHGIGKTVLQMWWYRLAYFFGVSPRRLRRHYDDVR